MSEAEFNDAYAQARRLQGGSQEEQLNFYAWGKIATGAQLPDKRPGMFDPVGRKKFDHWKEVQDSGVTIEEARKKYVAQFNELKDKHGLKDA